MRAPAALLAALLAHPVLAHSLRAQSLADSAARDSAPALHLSAFVDGYYAYDFNRPPTFDRSFAGGALFTTQPARHNEFNVNLAFAEATLQAPHYHGRVAVQFGTSVRSNYLGTPTIGQVSGPTPQQYLQEAYGGIKLGRKLWIDGGIFSSNIGLESFVSRDNPTYTRSLVSEYSPYFATGVRAMYAVTSKLQARLDIVNGWQNFSENNQAKGAGIRLDYTPVDGTTLSYYNLFSDEAGTRLRTINGLGAKVTRGRLTLVAEGDVGTQARPVGVVGNSVWYGLLGIARVQLSPVVAVAGRVERYDDPDQVILQTGARDVVTATGATLSVANPAFRGNAASLGLDVQPYPRVLLRTEVRGFVNPDRVFPDHFNGAPHRADGFAVASLALTF